MTKDQYKTHVLKLQLYKDLVKKETTPCDEHTIKELVAYLIKITKAMREADIRCLDCIHIEENFDGVYICTNPDRCRCESLTSMSNGTCECCSYIEFDESVFEGCDNRFSLFSENELSEKVKNI